MVRSTEQTQEGIFMLKTQPAEKITAEKESQSGTRLGITTKLPQKSVCEPAKTLSSLKKRFLQNDGISIKDKYILAETSMYVLDIYEHNKGNFEDLIPPKKREKKLTFDRQHFCQNILADASIAKLTDETVTLVNNHIAYCGNIWTCPICCALIQARRAEEIRQLVDYADTHDKKVIMLTLTASHNASYMLYDFGQRLQDAYTDMMHDTTYARKKLHEFGRIKASEYTYSYRNGWHKHFHVLVVVDADADVSVYEDVIKQGWERACIAHGLLDATDNKAIDDFRAHAAYITEGQSADVVARYVTKISNDWGIPSEMANSCNKQGRGTNHYTPFQLLVNILVDDDGNSYYLNKDIRAYIEYACYTKSRHQLDWSRGLKAKIGIEDKDDDALLDESNENATILYGLTVAHWHLLRSRRLMANYKHAFAVGGVLGVAEFFHKCDSNLPDLLTVEQCQLYESSEDSPARQVLMDVLHAITASQPKTYKSIQIKRDGKKHFEPALTAEEKMSVQDSKQAVVNAHTVNDFGDFIPAPPATEKTIEQIQAEWIARKNRPVQTTLFPDDKE